MVKINLNQPGPALEREKPYSQRPSYDPSLVPRPYRPFFSIRTRLSVPSALLS